MSVVLAGQQTLAEALRPRTIDDIVGQDHLKTVIKKFIQAGCQQWLFYGPTGTGKTSLARIVAVELDGSIIEKNSAGLGINEVNYLGDLSETHPMQGTRHVFILDEAQALTEAAKTALLKPLEDTNAITVWILCTTDVGKLSHALRHRCKSFELRKMGPIERRELVARAARHLAFGGDTQPFIKEADRQEVSSARDLIVSFESFVTGMKAEDALRA